MAKTVVAKSTDTLCGIAIREGFLNCNPLRAQEANKAYRTRELLAGDKVFVPDLRKKEEGRPTTDTHRFKRKRWPEPSLRFVRGSKTRVAAANMSDFRAPRSRTMRAMSRIARRRRPRHF